jgi:RNA polymerase sigma-70 factor, ECF subfamily
VKEFDVISSNVSAIPTSLTLLDKIRRKDQVAWERLVSLYTPLVYYWCKRAGLRPPDAEEVGQEVFLAVSRAIGSYHHDQKQDTFRGWMWQITRNKIRDHAPPPGGKGIGGSDAQRYLLEMASPGPVEEAESAPADVERNILFRRAVEMIEVNFEPKTRRAFWLLISGGKANDVAVELGMSASAVYTAKSKILKCLREEFRGTLEMGISSAPQDEA